MRHHKRTAKYAACYNRLSYTFGYIFIGKRPAFSSKLRGISPSGFNTLGNRALSNCVSTLDKPVTVERDNASGKQLLIDSVGDNTSNTCIARNRRQYTLKRANSVLYRAINLYCTAEYMLAILINDVAKSLIILNSLRNQRVTVKREHIRLAQVLIRFTDRDRHFGNKVAELLRISLNVGVIRRQPKRDKPVVSEQRSSNITYVRLDIIFVTAELGGKKITHLVIRHKLSDRAVGRLPRVVNSVYRTNGNSACPRSGKQCPAYTTGKIPCTSSSQHTDNRPGRVSSLRGCGIERSMQEIDKRPPAAVLLTVIYNIAPAVNALLNGVNIAGGVNLLLPVARSVIRHFKNTHVNAALRQQVIILRTLCRSHLINFRLVFLCP